MDSTGRVTQQQTVRRSDRAVKLEIPEELEIVQTYSLVVTSDDLSLSARILKEKKADRREESKRRIHNEEFKRRTQKMGAALIDEGMRNLDLIARGGAGVFDSSTTTSDAYAHGMRGIIRAGQEMNSEIVVLVAVKPSACPEDLERLTPDELQKRFEKTFIKDREFEAQRMKASRDGDMKELNRISQLELTNSQLLINLAQALERKGVTPLIPQSTSYNAGAGQAAEAQPEVLKGLEEGCRTQ